MACSIDSYEVLGIRFIIIKNIDYEPISIDLVRLHKNNPTKNEDHQI